MKYDKETSLLKKIIISIGIILFIHFLFESFNFYDSLKKINNVQYLEKEIQGKKPWIAIDSTLSQDQIDDLIKSKKINKHMTKSFYLKNENIDIFVSYSWKEDKCMVSARSNTNYKKMGDLLESTFPVDINWSGFTHKKYSIKESNCNLLFGYGQIK